MDLKGFLKIALGIGETFVPAIATVEHAVTAIKSGGDKKAAVLEIVKASPAIAEAISQKDIVNNALFEQGISKVNDGYVDIMNSLKK